MRSLIGLALASVVLLSCSDESDPKVQPVPDAAPPSTTDPYSGDCTTARWANVSDACWSCLCGGCAETLNACGKGCIEIMECAMKESTLVGNLSEIQCEIRATLATCSPGGEDENWNQAATFDTCLIATPKPTMGPLRICEEECGIKYSGDVCERFPEPDAGTP
jgi:hypothetical protein